MLHNIQGIVVDEEELERFDPNELDSVATAPSSEFQQQISRVLDFLKQSSRPVMQAGSGIRHAKATKEFLELVDRLGIPVLTSRRGADLVPDDHPYFFGRPGTYGQRIANFVIQNCDLLISIGSWLSIPLVGRNTKAFARAARKIVVNIDPNELEKPTLQPDLPIAMDGRQFIRECLSLLPTSRDSDDTPAYAPWIERCREWRRQFPPDSYIGASVPSDPPADSSDNGLIYPLSILKVLSDELSENDVLIADGGATLIYILSGFRFKQGQRLISSTGLELPGFALAGAIGASVARNRGPVVCLCEDRSFQISIQDLQTIVDYRLPIKVLIFKSKGHSIIRNIQRDYFGGRFVGADQEIRLGSAPLIQIAKTFGFPTFEAARANQLTTTIQEWLAVEDPAICEIQIEDDQDKIPRPGSTIRDDQHWIAKPLEDMYPFLDRQTLAENMVIDMLQEG